MTFSFSPQQILDITAKLTSASAARDNGEVGAYVDAYEFVFTLITDVDQTTGEETPKAGIDSAIERGAWVFLRGVPHVNALW